MQVLVTRPAADAKALTAALERRGHKVLLQPLLSITAVAPEQALDLDGFQALLFTSANGVRALAGLTARRDLPVLAVGDATAKAAREAGFSAVESARGDVTDLVRLVRDRLDPAAGPLFHGAATVVAGDLKRDLESAGFAIERRVLYRADPVPALAHRVEAAWLKGEVEAALFFSPRTAQSFVRLVRAPRLAGRANRCHAIALSPAVAKALKQLPWASVRTAEHPTTEALLKGLDLLAI